jgi:ABC-2 type transport system ATP-binding protein
VKPIFVDGISKSFGKSRVLNGVNLAVEEGDIFGFLGPNGAGKTTTLLILLGLLEPNEGTARVFGRDYGRDADVRKRAGVVLDSHGLHETMTLGENLRFFARFYGVSFPETRAGETAELVGLSDRLDTRVGELSHGLKRRSALARALVHSPDLLFLDEPTTGLDPEAQVDFRELLLELNRERGTTVFLNSHNLEEVQKLCGRVGLLHRGSLLLCGSLEELRAGAGTGEGPDASGADLGADPGKAHVHGRYELTVAGTEDAGRVEKILRSAPWVSGVSREGRRIRCTAEKGIYPLEAIVGAEIELESFNRTTDSLEDLYLRSIRAAEGSAGTEGDVT